MDDCARMGCTQPAVALLTFAPQQAKAWLYDLTDPDPTAGISLCRKHANSTVVPMAWQLIDARDPAWPGRATAADEMRKAADDAAVIAEAKRVVSLPRDAVSFDSEFVSLDDLPIAPQPYAATRQPVARTAMPEPADLIMRREPAVVVSDPSLFEFPIGDIPAVTPHPGYS